MKTLISENADYATYVELIPVDFPEDCINVRILSQTGGTTPQVKFESFMNSASLARLKAAL